MSCIYYIKHKETGKMYIGQTVQPLEQRMKQHIVGNIEIDKLIQQLGIDAFEYGVLEQCNSEELDEKEIYYIAKYDTYYNGYNNQLGGRKTGKNKYDNIIESIRQDYINGMSIIDLNIKYKISSYNIRYFVKDLEQEYITNNKTNINKEVIGYTKDWKRVGIFNSIRDALDFVNNQRQKDGKPEVDDRNFYRTIKTACIKNGIASGYRWQYREDVIYDEKEFNSSVDKENYLLGVNYEYINGIIFCMNENICKTRRLIDIDLVKKLAKENTNKEIAEKLGFNVHSLNRIAKEHNIVFKVNSNVTKSSKINEDIFNKIQSGYTYKQLADEYNLDYNAVRSRYNKYLKRNNILKEDNRVINGVTCIELSLSFESLVNAARYLKGDEHLTASELKGISYSISKAARNGHTYKGYHWKINE